VGIFFCFAQYGVFLLIINGYVGSFASSRMLSGQAELPKTAQKLPTSSHLLPTYLVGRQACFSLRSEIKVSYMRFCSIFLDFYSSYNGA
jgi:hypothetical protein